MSEIEVLQPGALTTIQDLGRPGMAHLGVSRSGAADRNSLRRANRLVGNDDGTPGLETTLTGPRLRARSDCVVALAGARARATIEGEPVQFEVPLALRAGETLRIGTPSVGLRSYVAVSGGIEAALVLGSCASDTRSGLGPAPVVRGQILRVGDRVLEFAPTGPDGTPTPTGGEPVLGVVLGPDHGLFGADSLRRLFATAFTVSSDSNRVGLRLEGDRVPTAEADQRRSAGLAHGSIQVPPDGSPIIMGADHPTTGGYPVIGVIVDRDIDTVGQLRPGQRLRFRRTEPQLAR